jgi:hypothetical protein
MSRGIRGITTKLSPRSVPDTGTRLTGVAHDLTDLLLGAAPLPAGPLLQPRFEGGRDSFRCGSQSVPQLAGNAGGARGYATSTTPSSPGISRPTRAPLSTSLAGAPADS